MEPDRPGEATAAAAAPVRLSRGKRLLFSAILLLGVVLLLEPGFRLARVIAGENRTRLVKARTFFVGVSGWFQPWPYVGYRIAPNEADPYLRADDGFRSTRPVARARDGSRVRIAFVGGSTTFSGNDWGYLGSFPYFVERFLERAHLPVEVMNCGTPGWTSVENLINYQLTIQEFSPDWLVIHQGMNDIRPRCFPNFRADYGHCRQPLVLPSPGLLERLLVKYSDLYVWLALRARRIPNDLGDLVDVPRPPYSDELAPGSLAVFRRNTEDLIRLAQADGTRVLLTTESYNRSAGEEEAIMRQAIVEENDVIREIARERSLPLADTDRALADRPSVFLDFCHVTPAGNRVKAREIARALAAAGLDQDPRFHREERAARRRPH